MRTIVVIGLAASPGAFLFRYVMKDFNIGIEGLTNNPIKFWINDIDKVRREVIPDIEKQLPAEVSNYFKTFQEQIYKAIKQRPDFKETKEFTDNFFLVVYASYLSDCLTYSFVIQKFIKKKEAIKQMLITYSQNYFRLASITTAILTDGETLKESIQKLTSYQRIEYSDYKKGQEIEELKSKIKNKETLQERVKELAISYQYKTIPKGDLTKTKNFNDKVRELYQEYKDALQPKYFIKYFLETWNSYFEAKSETHSNIREEKQIKKAIENIK